MIYGLLIGIILSGAFIAVANWRDIPMIPSAAIIRNLIRITALSMIIIGSTTLIGLLIRGA